MIVIAFLPLAPLAQNPLGLISGRKQKMSSGYVNEYKAGLEQNPSETYKQ